MASRLYRTTRQLYRHVAQCLRSLGVPALGTPTLAVLIALYVTGLLLPISVLTSAPMVRKRHSQ